MSRITVFYCLIMFQFMQKMSCPFLGRLSAPYLRRNGNMLAQNYANHCPVASRMFKSLADDGNQTQGTRNTRCKFYFLSTTMGTEILHKKFATICQFVCVSCCLICIFLRWVIFGVDCRCAGGWPMPVLQGQQWLGETCRPECRQGYHRS